MNTEIHINIKETENLLKNINNSDAIHFLVALTYINFQVVN